MGRTHFSDIVLGDRIAEPVFTEEGALLLNEGAIINDEVLSRLQNHEISYVDILDSLSEGIVPRGIIDEEQMEESICAVKNLFDEVMYREKLGVRTVIPDESFKLVEEVIESLMEALKNTKDLMYTVVDMMSTDEYTYKHSVNVAILSILTAEAMDYSRTDIKNIALGALLHDIGKLKVKDNLVNKPMELTKEEQMEMKRHSEYGYELTKAVGMLPYMAKQIIHLHHEKLDGSGYPLGLKGIEIPEYVRIVTVCDMYDAMTSNRIYRSKMPIYTALEILMRDAVYRIDPKIYRVLTSTICIFPPGSGIILSDERAGIVMSYNKENPTRPTVRVLDIDTKKFDIKVEIVKLDQVQTLFIDDVWDVDELKNGFKPQNNQASYPVGIPKKGNFVG